MNRTQLQGLGADRRQLANTYAVLTLAIASTRCLLKILRYGLAIMTSSTSPIANPWPKPEPDRANLKLQVMVHGVVCNFTSHKPSQARPNRWLSGQTRPSTTLLTDYCFTAPTKYE
ncbi:hypothetical protein C8Q74DRAFT_220044 [Fomes fomentarius]|nr:hypothetical protein C8Q74DRAFT_220044 [Fomes fomentarius]